MLKISITLPNQAQINLETADAAVIDKILAVVLRDLDRNLAGVADKGPPLPAAHAHAPVAETPPPAAPPSVPPQSAPPPDPAPSPVLTWETAAAEVPEQESDPSPWPAAIPVPAAAALSNPPAAALEPDEQEDWPDFADGDEDDDDEDDLAADAAAAANAAVSRLAVNGAAAAAIRPGMFAPSEQAFIDFCREASPLGDMRRVVVAAEAASRYLGMSGVDAQGLGHLFNLAGWPPAHSFTQTLRNAARSKFRWLERVPGRAGYYAVTDQGRKTALGE